MTSELDPLHAADPVVPRQLSWTIGGVWPLKLNVERGAPSPVLLPSTCSKRRLSSIRSH